MDVSSGTCDLIDTKIDGLCFFQNHLFILSSWFVIDVIKNLELSF